MKRDPVQRAKRLLLLFAQLPPILHVIYITHHNSWWQITQHASSSFMNKCQQPPSLSMLSLGSIVQWLLAGIEKKLHDKLRQRGCNASSLYIISRKMKNEIMAKNNIIEWKATAALWSEVNTQLTCQYWVLSIKWHASKLCFNPKLLAQLDTLIITGLQVQIAVTEMTTTYFAAKT